MSIDSNSKGNFFSGRNLVYETYSNWCAEGKDLGILKKGYDSSKSLDEILATSLPILLENKDTQENRADVTAFLTLKFNKTEQDKNNPKTDRLEKLFNKIANRNFSSSCEKGRNLVYKTYERICGEGSDGKLSAFKRAYKSIDSLATVLGQAGRFVNGNNDNKPYVESFLTAKFNKTQSDPNDPKKDRLAKLFEKLSEKGTFLSAAEKKKKHEKKEAESEAPKLPEPQDSKAEDLNLKGESQLQAGDPSFKIQELQKEIQDLQEQKLKLREEKRNLFSSNLPVYTDFRFEDWIKRLKDCPDSPIRDFLIDTLTSMLSTNSEAFKSIYYTQFERFKSSEMNNLSDEVIVCELKGFAEDIERKIKDQLQANDSKTVELTQKLNEKIDELKTYLPESEEKLSNDVEDHQESEESSSVTYQEKLSKIQLSDLKKALKKIKETQSSSAHDVQDPLSIATSLPETEDQLEIEALIEAEKALKENPSTSKQTSDSKKLEKETNLFEGIPHDEMSPEYQAALLAQSKPQTPSDVGSSDLKSGKVKKKEKGPDGASELKEKPNGFKAFLLKVATPFIAIGKFFTHLFQSIRNLFVQKEEEPKA